MDNLRFHLRLIGKRVVDFLLMLIKVFRYVLRLRRYGRKETENRRYNKTLYSNNIVLRILCFASQ